MARCPLTYLLKYAIHLIKAHPRGGFGIHSPYLFKLITRVIEEQTPYYCYQTIEKYRQNLLNDTSFIQVLDLGTGKSGKRKVGDIAKKSLKSSSEAQLLFRLALHSKANTLLELGTSLGITTMYLARTCSQSKIITIEGCPQTAAIATTLFKNARLNNIEQHTGSIDTVLPQILQNVNQLDFVYFDANHRQLPTWNYFTLCLAKKGPQSIFIFDDIHHSAEMEAVWKQICEHSEVRVSIDLFTMGIVLFNPDLQKAHYLIAHLP